MDGSNMTLDAQIEAIRAEISKDASESAYHCELEYHLDYMIAEMQKAHEAETSESSAAA
jgi:hypothetical protein